MIEQVEHLLKGLIGLDAESVGRTVIERALRQRMTVTGNADAQGYWACLNRSVEEQQALVEAVVVPETWFFRYPESFAALVGLAFKRQAALAGSRPLRLLSLPCSSGEEPYSIAMALLDAGFAPAAFQIMAVDVSVQALELARRGHYARNSFRSPDLGFRERHFTAEVQGFLLHERVRAQVEWRCGNLLDSQLLAGERAFDFVFCRNLLIYFDRPTQHKALVGLERLLDADGTFFVGPAEAGLFSQRCLRALNEPLTFAFRRGEQAPQSPPLRGAAPRPVARAAAVVTVPRTLPRARAAAQPTPAPVPAPAGHAPAAPGLATVAELANAGHSDAARLACERYLAEQGPCAEAFYWLGLLSEVAGQADAAQGYYRKVLYLDPEHAETLAHLAALLAERGDREGAKRLQQRAVRASHSGVKRDGR